MFYIYKIYFPISNKCYIGQTVNLEHRLIRHIRSKQLIGLALNKYDDWQVEVLHICNSKEEANRLEIEEIRNYNSKVPNGYNMTDGGENPPSFYGKHLSKEAKRKISEANKGNKYALGNKSGLGRKPNLGKKFTEEHKRKLSESHKGMKNALRHKLSKNSKRKSLITFYKNKIKKLDLEINRSLISK